MMWIHVNKYGINEAFDAEQVRFVYLGKDTDIECFVGIMYKDGMNRAFASEELSRNKDKCHELIRDIAAKLGSASITNKEVEKPKRPPDTIARHL